MTMKSLLEYFEKYYGQKYAGVFLDTMTSYLDGYPSDFYKVAAEVLVKRFSRTYGKVPDVAIFEKNMDEIFSLMPKPYVLPEPRREITEEERTEGLKLLENIKQMSKEKNGESMSSVLTKTLNSIGKNHDNPALMKETK